MSTNAVAKPSVYVRLVNGLALFLAIGSCLFLMSVNNSGDIYLDMIGAAGTGQDSLAPYFARLFFSLPVLIGLGLAGLLLVLKELMSLRMATKLKVNVSAAVVLLVSCIAVARLVAYPVLAG